MKKLSVVVFLALASLASAAPPSELKFALNWLLAFEAEKGGLNDSWTRMLSKSLSKEAKVKIAIMRSLSGPVHETYIYDLAEKSFTQTDVAAKFGDAFTYSAASESAASVMIKKGNLEVFIQIRSTEGKSEVIGYQATIYD